MSNRNHDYLKYWRVIRYFIKAKYNLTQADLDILFFLYSESYFSKDRFELIDIFLDLGINRIGIADTFIHIDVDPDKSPNVIWTY